jgi:hypothetical protein
MYHKEINHRERRESQRKNMNVMIANKITKKIFE